MSKKNNKSNKAIKYRIYPTEKQKELILQTVGCTRKVFNYFLEYSEDRYKATKNTENIEYFSCTYCIKQLPLLKKEFSYLNDVDSISLQQAIRHLDTAYQNFYKKQNKKPKLKTRKRSRTSYSTVNVNNNIEVLDEYIKLPKLGKVKAIIHRNCPEGYILKSATVSMERNGSFYCSLLYEFEKEQLDSSINIENSIAFDYKSDGFYVDSEGNTLGSPKYYRKSQDKLAKEQRKLARMQGYRKGETKSKNFKKQQIKINKVYRHLANQRLDFVHKQSAKIANSYDIVCVEDLNMQALSNKGFKNGKATMDNAYGLFLNLLYYKLNDKGKVLIKVDKFYPSSQICNCCGYKNTKTKDLSIRKITCPCCNTTYDRDENATKNILKEGLRLYQESIN